MEVLNLPNEGQEGVLDALQNVSILPDRFLRTNPDFSFTDLKSDPWYYRRVY